MRSWVPILCAPPRLPCSSFVCPVWQEPPHHPSRCQALQGCTPAPQDPPSRSPLLVNCSNLDMGLFHGAGDASERLLGRERTRPGPDSTAATDQTGLEHVLGRISSFLGSAARPPTPSMASRTGQGGESGFRLGEGSWPMFLICPCSSSFFVPQIPGEGGVVRPRVSIDPGGTP